MKKIITIITLLVLQYAESSTWVDGPNQTVGPYSSIPQFWLHDEIDTEVEWLNVPQLGWVYFKPREWDIRNYPNYAWIWEHSSLEWSFWTDSGALQDMVYKWTVEEGWKLTGRHLYPWVFVHSRGVWEKEK